MVWLVPNLCVHLAAFAVHGDDGRLIEAHANRLRVAAEERGWEEMARFIEEKGWEDHKWANWNLEWGTWSDAVPRLAEELEKPEDREELFSFGGGGNAPAVCPHGARRVSDHGGPRATATQRR